VGSLSNGGRHLNEIWHKCSLGDEDDAQTSSMCIARTEKACDTTLYDEKDNLCHGIDRWIDRMCVIVTALCNQPEAFASDLGDDQSRYLFS